MGDPVRCLPKVVHPDVAALKLQHNQAINSETQRFGQWAFFKMGVLAGCVGGCAGVLFFLLTVLGLREALEALGLR